MSTQKPRLDKREFATVLAALRFWQSKLGPDRYPAQARARQDFEAYFEDGKKFAPLSAEEIDSLCERINVGEGEKDVQFREAAKKQFHREGEIEMDDDAVVARGDDEDGAYVEAWVWVDAESLKG